jgi:hypothetical protein
MIVKLENINPVYKTIESKVKNDREYRDKITILRESAIDLLRAKGLTVRQANHVYKQWERQFYHRKYLEGGQSGIFDVYTAIDELKTLDGYTIEDLNRIFWN